MVQTFYDVMRRKKTIGKKDLGTWLWDKFVEDNELDKGGYNKQFMNALKNYKKGHGHGMFHYCESAELFNMFWACFTEKEIRIKIEDL